MNRTILGEQYRSLSSSLCSFLHSLLDPNISPSTQFSNTLGLRSSLNVSDQVPHPYKTTGNFFLCEHIVTRYVFTARTCISPNPQARGPPLVSCTRRLIQYIRSYPSYWRPFFHWQPENAPCRGDRDRLVTGYVRD